uniref:Uncharacterized protein n=1 Tax=Kalanchoe fedtschenkoi TaxID=63787 RepID=A0A7N0TPX5_KALFE
MARYDEPASASEIASCFPEHNPDKTPMLLDRMLHLLSSFSLLTCTQKSPEEGGPPEAQRFYALSPAGKYFVKNNVEGSLATFHQFISDSVQREAWLRLKDAVIEGVSPCELAYGLPIFQVIPQRYPEAYKLFNTAMSEISTQTMKWLLEIYNGFDGIKSLVDVGGGNGASLRMIMSVNPHITGINFDLPQVVEKAPCVPGLTHVGGDMFVRIPKGDAILLKNVLHNWGDENCVKLLKLCYDAIPENGKVIVIESIIPDTLSTGSDAKEACLRDVTMFILPEGKERTREEFINLARASGFSDARLICSYGTEWVIEFHK